MRVRTRTATTEYSEALQRAQHPNGKLPARRQTGYRVEEACLEVKAFQRKPPESPPDPRSSSLARDPGRLTSMGIQMVEHHDWHHDWHQDCEFRLAKPRAILDRRASLPALSELRHTRCDTRVIH